MEDYIIASASTADLPRSFFEEHDVPFISYTYTVNGTLFSDDCLEQTRQSSYLQMREGDRFTTSMINTQTYYDFFKALMEQGKHVLYLDMSREMSSSYQAATIAAQDIVAEFPEQKFYMMDTRCISGGLGLLLEEMVQRKEAGMSFEDLIAWGDANKLRIMHRFTVDDLNYLKRGGRVSNTSAMVGSLLSIKPVLYVPDEGTLLVASKQRGRKAALHAIIDGVKRDMTAPDGQTVHIHHADCLQDAQYVREAILEAFPTVKEVVISNLGIVIGAHCGPGLLAVFYFGEKRNA